MSKVLKVVGVVAAVGATILSGGLLGPLATSAITGFLGFGAGTLGLIALGASVGASLLAPGAKPAKPIQTSYDRLRANIDPRTPRKAIVGIVAMAADLR